jgi:hypothetical protein
MIELYGTEHVTVIGYGNGRHIVRYCLIEQARNQARPIEQAVLGMNV